MALWANFVSCNQHLKFMKKIIFGAAAFLLAGMMQAQNTNVTDVSTKTVTTVKDSEGEKKLVKSKNTKEVQNVEFQNADSKELNKDVKPSQVNVTSTTSITGPDGTTRTVDVDRSAYYSLGGNKMRFAMDPAGYTITNPAGQREAIMRRTSNNSYFYRTKDKTSLGYFDNAGNFVLETYDEKNDKITVEVLTRNP